MTRLKSERTRRGWTQHDLARLTSIRQPDISSIENGRVNPTPTELDALGRALGIFPAAVLLRPVSVQDPDETAHEVAYRG